MFLVVNINKSRERRSGLEQGTFRNSFLPEREFSFREILMILHIIETQNFIWQRHSVLPTELSKYPMTKMMPKIMPIKVKCQHYQHCCQWTKRLILGWSLKVFDWNKFQKVQRFISLLSQVHNLLSTAIYLLERLEFTTCTFHKLKRGFTLDGCRSKEFTPLLLPR